jgi:hypothetical protein
MSTVDRTTSTEMQPGAPSHSQDTLATNDDPRLLVQLYQQRLRTALLTEAAGSTRPSRSGWALGACRRIAAHVEQRLGAHRLGSAVPVAMSAGMPTPA